MTQRTRRKGLDTLQHWFYNVVFICIGDHISEFSTGRLWLILGIWLRGTPEPPILANRQPSYEIFLGGASTTCFDGLPPKALWGKALFIQGVLCRPLFSPPTKMPNIAFPFVVIYLWGTEHEQLLPSGYFWPSRTALLNCVPVCFLWEKKCFHGVMQFGIWKGIVPSFPGGREW